MIKNFKPPLPNTVFRTCFRYITSGKGDRKRAAVYPNGWCVPRQGKLRRKNGHWYSEAGSTSGVYFGRIDEVSHTEAKKRFAAHLASLSHRRPVGGSISTAAMFDTFLDSAKEHRSDRTYGERKLHLERFANFRRGADLIGDLAATSIHADDLKAFEDSLKKRELDPLTVHKHLTSVVAAFNWGAGIARLKNPRPCLPAGFRPFAQMERYRMPANELHEDELPTKKEVEALLKSADTDIASVYENGRWRTRKPEERRSGEANPYRGFQDLLTVYYSTGARTSELAMASVRDFLPSANQLVLGRHKRSKSLREAASRRITLNARAFDIAKKACNGKQGDEPIFTDPKGRRWERRGLDVRFKQVRKLAKVRDEITIYSFRHLWISESLMAGIDVATVAKMAGTSIAMIERVYGHFSGQHFQDAQDKLDAARAARDAKRTGAS
jgi:integrase